MRRLISSSTYCVREGIGVGTEVMRASRISRIGSCVSDLAYRVSYMTYEVRRVEGREGRDVSSMLLAKEVEVAVKTRVRRAGWRPRRPTGAARGGGRRGGGGPV